MPFTKNTSPIYYETTGVQTMKDGTKRRWVYRTKTLTPKHAALREAHPSAYTMECDPSVTAWIGIFSVVIAESQHQKAHSEAVMRRNAEADARRAERLAREARLEGRHV